MEPTEFLESLRASGGNLLIKDGSLSYESDQAPLSTSARSYIAENRGALIACLRREQGNIPCDIGGCPYIARYPQDRPRYCARKHGRLGLAKDADELLAPYAALIAQAENGDLVGTVGFQGGELDANAAVLLAREWIVTAKSLEDSDPYAPDALADWVNVLETLKATCSEKGLKAA